MISILLLLVLAWGFYIGYRRGLVLQVYYFLVAVISAFVAGQFYKSLGDHFHLLVPYANPQEGQGTFFFPSDQLFHLDKVFYAGLAYLLVFGICYTIGRFIGLFLHLIPTKKLDVKWFAYRIRPFISIGNLICLANGSDYSCNGAYGSCAKSP